jgi:hypothetical protein
MKKVVSFLSVAMTIWGIFCFSTSARAERESFGINSHSSLYWYPISTINPGQSYWSGGPEVAQINSVEVMSVDYSVLYYGPAMGGACSFSRKVVSVSSTGTQTLPSGGKSFQFREEYDGEQYRMSPAGIVPTLATRHGYFIARIYLNSGYKPLDPPPNNFAWTATYSLFVDSITSAACSESPIWGVNWLTSVVDLEIHMDAYGNGSTLVHREYKVGENLPTLYQSFFGSEPNPGPYSFSFFAP